MHRRKSLFILSALKLVDQRDAECELHERTSLCDVWRRPTEGRFASPDGAVFQPSSSSPLLASLFFCRATRKVHRAKGKIDTLLELRDLREFLNVINTCFDDFLVFFMYIFLGKMFSLWKIFAFVPHSKTKTRFVWPSTNCSEQEEDASKKTFHTKGWFIRSGTTAENSSTRTTTTLST